MKFKSKVYPNIVENNRQIRLYLLDFVTVTQLQRNDVPNFVEKIEPLIPEIIEYYGEELYSIQIILEHSFESIPLIIDGKHFFELIHLICEKYSISPKLFNYHTGNWRIHELYSSWKADVFPHADPMQMTCAMSLQRLYAPNIEQIPNAQGQQPNIAHCDSYSTESKPYVYNCLNRAPHIHRLHVFDQLHKRNLLDQGMVSMNEIKEQSSNYWGRISPDTEALLPMTLDVPKGSSAIDHIYRDAMPQAFQEIESKTYDTIPNAFAHIFDNTMVSLVTETNLGIPVHPELCCDCGGIMMPTHHNNCGECVSCDAVKPLPEWMQWHQHGFITEKTWRCMLNRHPVLWISAPNTTKTLHHLGFKTFDSVWSEHYDSIQNPIERIDAVLDIVKQLTDQSPSERSHTMTLLKPIVEHNHRMMMALRYPQILT